jgi:flagellar biosynthesis/type III secretory pathway protein FliH
MRARVTGAWKRLLCTLLGAELLRLRAEAWEAGYELGEDTGYAAGYLQGRQDEETALIGRFALLEQHLPPRLH